MTDPRILVDELADLTGMRDQELMDFSLLKTMDGFLLPHALRLLHIDSKGIPIMEISYRNRKCHVNHAEIALSEDMAAAIEYLGAESDEEFVLQRGNDVLLAYALHNLRGGGRAFLLVQAEALPTRQQTPLITGALQIYRNFCGLLVESQCDQLTGLSNRKTFDTAVNRIFKITQQAQEPFQNERRANACDTVWLAIYDIDHFKSINDKFGHIYGDEVLLIIAQILKQCFRGQDLIFRFGGEEFVVIMKCSDRAACASAVERFRKTVEDRQFPQVERVTVSAGVTQMQRGIYSITLLDYADKALYHSKRAGRNRITFFEDLVESGEAVNQSVQSGDITLF